MGVTYTGVDTSGAVYSGSRGVPTELTPQHCPAFAHAGPWCGYAIASSGGTRRSSARVACSAASRYLPRPEAVKYGNKVVYEHSICYYVEYINAFFRSN